MASGRGVLGRVSKTLYQPIEYGVRNPQVPIQQGGTSSVKYSSTKADLNFIQHYFENTSTSGTTRAIYNRLYIGGAGQSGESLRSFTTINGVAASTAHGAHLSLNFATVSAVVGQITGLGVAMRATLHVANGTMSNGTYASVQAEIYGDGASSSVSGMTNVSFIRAIVDGATADVKATMDTSGYLMSIQGLTVGSGKLFQVNTAAAATHALRIIIGSTPYYVMLTSTGA